MTEEEKKAIKWLKELYDIEKDFNSSAGKEESNIIKTLLNLIEKNQKEIGQLANGIRVLGTNPDITTEEIIKEFTEKPITEEYMKKFENSYISKDKLKALKEEVDKNRQNEIVDYYKLYDGIESLLEEK